MLNYKIPVRDEDIDDIMVTALEGGVNYWCESLDVVDDDYKGAKYASHVISRGGELIFRSFHGEVQNLTLDKLKRGFELFQEQIGVVFDVEQHDAGDADALIQLSLFGRLVYG